MMEDRILNEVLLSMGVDFLCILKSLLWAGRRRGPEREEEKGPEEA